MRADYLLQSQLDLILAGMLPDNRLCLRVCLYTGLRIGDVLELRADEVARQFWITERKTGKRRRVGLTDELVARLQRNARGSVWCFPSPRDAAKHRTRQAVWADCKRTARALRIPVNAAPHSCRKVYAVHLREKYGDIERVQRALNHDNPTVTMLYAMADVLAETVAARRVSLPRARRR